MTTRGPLIQNFTLTAGDKTVLHVNIDPDTIGVTLVGADIVWKVYEQKWGIPDRDQEVVSLILDDGIEITDTDTQTFDMTILKEHTLDLAPKNYYHETLVIGPEGDRITVNYGILTIGQTIIGEVA